MIDDPIERLIAEALDDAQINFIRDGEPGNQDARLDFYLPDFGTFIECKAYHTPRAASQLSRGENVILIQGRKAAELFASMISRDTTAIKQEREECAKMLDGFEQEFLSRSEESTLRNNPASSRFERSRALELKAYAAAIRRRGE